MASKKKEVAPQWKGCPSHNNKIGSLKILDIISKLKLVDESDREIFDEYIAGEKEHIGQRLGKITALPDPQFDSTLYLPTKAQPKFNVLIHKGDTPSIESNDYPIYFYRGGGLLNMYWLLSPLNSCHIFQATHFVNNNRTSSTYQTFNQKNLGNGSQIIGYRKGFRQSQRTLHTLREQRNQTNNQLQISSRYVYSCTKSNTYRYPTAINIRRRRQQHQIISTVRASNWTIPKHDDNTSIVSHKLYIVESSNAS
jgi:hypothetical protein